MVLAQNTYFLWRSLIKDFKFIDIYVHKQKIKTHKDIYREDKYVNIFEELILMNRYFPRLSLFTKINLSLSA